MIHASEIPCVGESVAPALPLTWQTPIADVWRVTLQDRYLTSLDIPVRDGLNLRRRAPMWLWNMAFSPVLMRQL